jgi:hypothetical protein
MTICLIKDRLYAVVVRVPGYRSRGPRSIPALPDFLRNNGSGAARGSVAVKALCYKSEGRGFDTR